MERENIQKGDRVEAIDDSLRGEVTGIRNGVLVIRTDEGFELQLSPAEVVKISDESLLRNASLSPDRYLADKEQPERRKKPVPKAKERDMPGMEVDLHIEKLVPSVKGLSNYDILTIQLDTATRQLEFAIRRRIRKVVFIHGVGEGVLRTELEFLFGRYDNLKYYDADYRKYGMGATEVYIYQNA
ncbi:Smr/MutS family protein [Sinomicrobium soli]|uniref:Smr/MutS family protein n=1 Tax=Sinomicrobium sp. N-1-3-6 TaxID=2219864 RepID=UPI000DCF5EDD|nr:Smr/MutS family protein [Sinomicrobium sp. N-1-3-6]RAV30600.1 DNA mismatch repair protein MutS [Sinomicrobium sp. N-1-3-6]